MRKVFVEEISLFNGLASCGDDLAISKESRKILDFVGFLFKEPPTSKRKQSFPSTQV